MTAIISQGKAFKRLVRERMAKTGELYTEARARMLAGAAADPQASIARNLNVPRGRRVVASDIAPHALPLHPPCNGKGWVKRAGEAVPCRCSTKRFLAAHPEIIMDDEGIAWWPAEKVDPSDGGQAA
jgi:hypothetical protein